MTRYDMEAIRQDHPIYDIVSQALPLEKAGKEYKACCPFHADRTPSFHVIPHKQFAHCHGCGWSGDVIKFIMDYKRIDFFEAVKMLVGDDGDDSHGLDQSPEAKAEREAAMRRRKEQEARDALQATQEARATWEAAGAADPHHPYLVRKQVAAHTLRQADNGALIIPVYDAEGEIQSIQRINDKGDKKFKAIAPMELGRMLIGINMGRIILCEGYATGATIYDAVPDQICVTFSMNNMEAVAREMAAQGRTIVLASDTGTSAERMSRLAAELNCPVVSPRPGMNLPPDKDGEIKTGSDFNDQALIDGVASVAEWFRKALKVYAERLSRIEEAGKDEAGPVDLWQAYKPPALPRGLLPDVIDRFAFQSAEQMGTDPAGFAMSALAACAAVLKDDICIRTKQHEDWHESARIWVMLIGKPSTRKTPMMKRATRAIKKLDAQMLRENNKALSAWQEDGGSKSGNPKPLTPRLRIEDATTEAAQDVCRESPNGIMVLQDELQGLFGRIEKYGGGKSGGGDRSFWLQAYGGGQYAVNRVGRGSYLIDNLSVTMLGGVQPDTIRRIMQDSSDDGLIQRFIPIVLQPAGMDKDIETPPVADEFNALVERLFDMEPPSNFFGKQAFTLDEGARKIREEMVERHYRVGSTMEDFNTKLATHIGKYDGLFPRLCVIWHCIENVEAETLPKEVSEDTARRVADFMTHYLVPHAMAFYTSTIGLSDGQDMVRDVGGYILAHKKEAVTVRDAERAIRHFRSLRDDEQMRVMAHLEAFGWLERADKRRDAASWNVMPEVHQMFADKAQKERERRAEIRQAISEIVEEKRF